jgi:hypothetical protein
MKGSNAFHYRHGVGASSRAIAINLRKHSQKTLTKPPTTPVPLSCDEANCHEGWDEGGDERRIRKCCIENAASTQSCRVHAALMQSFY